VLKKALEKFSEMILNQTEDNEKIISHGCQRREEKSREKISEMILIQPKENAKIISHGCERKKKGGKTSQK
jgi:hypothetical protein